MVASSTWAIERRERHEQHVQRSRERGMGGDEHRTRGALHWRIGAASAHPKATYDQIPFAFLAFFCLPQALDCPRDNVSSFSGLVLCVVFGPNLFFHSHPGQRIRAARVGCSCKRQAPKKVFSPRIIFLAYDDSIPGWQGGGCKRFGDSELAAARTKSLVLRPLLTKLEGGRLLVEGGAQPLAH